MKNILLIVVDCARAEQTVTDIARASPGTRRSACLPFLDHLRTLGSTWTSFNAVSSTTVPNFATMFTGLLLVQHSMVQYSTYVLRDGIPTVASILEAQGYNTYAEVVEPLLPACGLNKGFRHYHLRPATYYLHDGFRSDLERQLSEIVEPWFFCLHLREVHTLYQNPQLFDEPQFGYSPHDRSLSFVDSVLWDLFRDLDYSNTSVIFTGDHGERLTTDYDLNENLGGREAQVLKVWDAYLQQARGRIDYDEWFMYAQERLGEASARTYVHQRLGHGFHLTEDLIRVPLVIVDRDLIRPGSSISALRGRKDMFRTIPDIAEISHARPSYYDGHSLFKEVADDKVYIEANGSRGPHHTNRCFLRGARNGRFKYWRFEGGSEKHEVLWDLENDPREISN